MTERYRHENLSKATDAEDQRLHILLFTPVIETIYNNTLRRLYGRP